MIKTKINWYKLAESNLYELKTLPMAIKNLQKRSDENSKQILETKLELQESLKEIMGILTEEEQDFINKFYNKLHSPVKMQQEMCISQATFYRIKRTVVKKVAQYRGYL